MFRSPLQVAAMTWHSRVQPGDNFVRHASQARAWTHMNTSPQFQNFGDDPRNLRLGLATDGINPFSEKTSVHSTLPVLLLNYNVPPWMTTKRYFVMLSLFIPGPRAVTGKNFDVYLALLLEELLLLWNEGVLMQDAAAWNGKAPFILRTMVIWTVHDLPRYGIVAGYTTKGYMGCPVCGPNTHSWRATTLQKKVYENFRVFLVHDHRMRWDITNYGVVEEGISPTPMFAQDVLRYVAIREAWLQEGNTLLSSGDLLHLTGIKRRSALYDLPYWKVRPPNQSKLR